MTIDCTSTIHSFLLKVAYGSDQYEALLLKKISNDGKVEYHFDYIKKNGKEIKEDKSKELFESISSIIINDFFENYKKR